MSTGNLHDLRQSYERHRLDDRAIHENPFAQFAAWFQDAVDSPIGEPNAMMLATADAAGVVSSRMVLLKSYDERGFVFYTNYRSRKGRSIAENPHVAITFFWDVLERQIHIEGTAQKVSDEESDNYFHSRPDGHQLGAWVSPQSEIIPDRAYLEGRLEEMQARFQQEPLYRPPHWGGFRIAPTRFEFWQGRANRLHDRIEYRLTGDYKWENNRLAP